MIGVAMSMHRRARRLLTLPLIFASIPGAGHRLAAAAPAPQSVAERPSLPPLSVTLDRSTRLLVVSPHPDDEALGAAGLIQRVRAAGGAVRVLLVTSGDGFPEGIERADGISHPRASDFRSYGQTRERETLAAMALLGLSP